MHEVDPRNIETLFGMWTVFHKCSQNIKDGSRLENLSWRLWARETLCCPPQPEKTIVPAIDVPAGRASEVPSLSNSFAESDESASDREDDSRRRRIRSPSCDDQDSALSKSRGKELHLTPTTLKKIVVHIQERSELGPLSPSIEASITKPIEEEEESLKKEVPQDKSLQNSTDSCRSEATATTSSTTNTRPNEHRTSDTSVSSDGLIRTGSVVHGFSPVSTSFKSKPLSTLPIPSSRLAISPASKPGMFQLGASSEDDDSSFEMRPSALKPPPVRSSLSHSMTRRQISSGSTKKTTSFRDIVEARKLDSDAEADEGAIASDSEEDDSVFEDEDEDWEDSPSDEEKLATTVLPTFRRVESRPDLVSRPSMLSMQIDQRRRASSGLQNEISHSQPVLRRSRVSTPTGPSMPASPNDHDDDAGLMMGGGNARARPIVMPQQSQQSMAHSPRTTRRNMLSTELTESLRKNLLWERQQKSQTVNAFIKRNRNAQSMANLTTAALQPPPQPEHKSNNSWGQEYENAWEFNAKGW